MMYEVVTVRLSLGPSAQVYNFTRHRDAKMAARFWPHPIVLHSIRTCFDATEHALRLDKPQIFTRTLER